MDATAIYNNIRTLAHDRGMSDAKVSLHINQAIAELRGLGYLNDNIQTNENITVKDGETAIVVAHPVKTILKCSAEITFDSDGIRLLSPAVGDTQVTISYVSQITDWDGSEANNILDPWFYIYGAVYYACASKLSPETTFYRQQFSSQIGRMFGDSVFMDGGENVSSSELMGI